MLMNKYYLITEDEERMKKFYFLHLLFIKLEISRITIQQFEVLYYFLLWKGYKTLAF